MAKKIGCTTDSWSNLKQYTDARIALGRAGGSLSTKDWLDFKLAHAKARDAVHCEFNCDDLVKQLQKLDNKILLVNSQVKNRLEYLQRPDLGRFLDDPSISLLKAEKKPADVVFIICDGLSATAVHAHASNLLGILLPALSHLSWSIAPLVIAKFGRVALEDPIGFLMGVKIAVILIGERPGLSSPDSLGAYLVFNPKPGNTDADRNCVSNIRPAGLDYQKAADTLFYLLNQVRQRKYSGVQLKDKRIVMDNKKLNKEVKPCAIYAHRGARKEAADNTRSAFDKALKYSIDGIETDVQLTKDEITVLFHDRIMDRLGYAGQHISDFTLAQLKTINFLTGFSGTGFEGVLTLEEFLRTYRDQCKLQIEIKHRDWEDQKSCQIKVQQCLDLIGESINLDIIISSFSLVPLEYAHKLGSKIPLFLAFKESDTGSYVENILENNKFLAGICHPISTLNASLVNSLHIQNKLILTYTGNTAEEIKKALDLEVDGLISDYPNKALKMRD